MLCSSVNLPLHRIDYWAIDLEDEIHIAMRYSNAFTDTLLEVLEVVVNGKENNKNQHRKIDFKMKK